MKKKLGMMLLVIVLGFLFTFFVLNKQSIYAKEEYSVYAFQVGAFENKDNATKLLSKLPSGIVITDKNLYKVYMTICKDTDIVNKMVVYLEKNGYNIYLKSLKVSKNFYETLDSYEKILSSAQESSYNKINQSILNAYIESLQND